MSVSPHSWISGRYRSDWGELVSLSGCSTIVCSNPKTLYLTSRRLPKNALYTGRKVIHNSRGGSGEGCVYSGSQDSHISEKKPGKIKSFFPKLLLGTVLGVALFPESRLLACSGRTSRMMERTKYTQVLIYNSRLTSSQAFRWNLPIH